MRQFNILMVVVDSVKATALPVYGNPYCRTPNVERAAARGVTVSHCFGQMPKCVPNRSTMLTGRYPHVDGLRALKGRLHPVGGTDLFLIPGDMPNVLPLLKEAGYELCHKGPNHLVTWDAYEEWFDVPMNWEAAEKCVSPPRTTDDPELIRAQYYGPVPEDYDLELTKDAEPTRQMVEFLRDRDGGRPFFAYLDLRTPHPRYRDWPVFANHYAGLDLPPPPKMPLKEAPWTERVYRETYDLENMAPEKWSRIARAYLSGISVADMLFGRVLDAVEQEGLSGDTVVMFTGDHGDFAGEHGCVEKHDPFLYDSLTRLPFIAVMPPGHPEGRFAECMIEQIDLAPTLLELAGMEVPRWVQGKSFLPVLSGESETHKDAVFAQGGVEREAIERNRLLDERELYGRTTTQYDVKQKVILDEPDFMMRARMVRTRRYKYIYRLNGRHEFYDLEEDPAELRTQVDNPRYADAIANLRERLLHWMVESETNLPLLKGAYS